MANGQELIIDYLDGSTFERSVGMLAKLLVEGITFAVFAGIVTLGVYLSISYTPISLPPQANLSYVFTGTFLFTFKKGWCFQTRMTTEE